MYSRGILLCAIIAALSIVCNAQFPPLSVTQFIPSAGTLGGLKFKGLLGAFLSGSNVYFINATTGTVMGSPVSITGAGQLSTPLFDTANGLGVGPIVHVFSLTNGTLTLNSIVVASGTYVTRSLAPLNLLPECGVFDSVSRQAVMSFPAPIPAVLINVAAQTNGTVAGIFGSGSMFSCYGGDLKTQTGYFASNNTNLVTVNFATVPPTTTTATLPVSGGSATQIVTDATGNSVVGTTKLASGGSTFVVNSTSSTKTSSALPAAQSSNYFLATDPYDIGGFTVVGGISGYSTTILGLNATLAGVPGTGVPSTGTLVGVAPFEPATQGASSGASYALDSAGNLNKVALLIASPTATPSPTAATPTGTNSGVITTTASSTTFSPTPTASTKINGAATIGSFVAVVAATVVAVSLF